MTPAERVTSQEMAVMRKMTRGLTSVNFILNGCNYPAAIDTGASRSIISADVLYVIERGGYGMTDVTILDNPIVMTSFCGGEVRIRQRAVIEWKTIEGKIADIDVCIVDGVCKLAILGMTDSIRLWGLWIPACISSNISCCQKRTALEYGPSYKEAFWKELSEAGLVKESTLWDPIEHRNRQLRTVKAKLKPDLHPAALMSLTAGTPSLILRKDTHSFSEKRSDSLYESASSAISIPPQQGHTTITAEDHPLINGMLSTPILLSMSEQDPLGMAGITYSKYRDLGTSANTPETWSDSKNNQGFC
jgi:hypothetical protein